MLSSEDANKKDVGLLSVKEQAQRGQPLPEATPAKPRLDLLLSPVGGHASTWFKVDQASTCAG